MQDQFGNPVSGASADAIKAYDRAVDAQLHAWPGVSEACDEAIAAEPKFALPHALKALALAAYGRMTDARDEISRAVDAKPATTREESFLTLVATVLRDGPVAALPIVIEHSRRFPTDALAASTAMGAYGLFAFSGRADHDARRREFLDALAPHYPAEFPWLLANRGWARIECGDVEEGLAMALRAIALRPSNAHNAHHVMHGYYEAGEPGHALDFVGKWLSQYPDHGLMWGHLQWHAALAELERGDTDAATVRLLGPILEYLPRGSPFMGLADIASLLWRMGLHRLPSLPWEAAQRHAAQHFGRGSNVFGELHLAMLAAARRDRGALDAGAARLAAQLERGHEGAAVAMSWTHALGALVGNDLPMARQHFAACRQGLARLGGSHAQRSVIERTQDALALPEAG